MDRFLKMGSKIGDNRKYVESSFVWNSRGGVNGGERRNLTGRGLLWKKWRREREGEEKHGWKYCETRSVPTFRIRWLSMWDKFSLRMDAYGGNRPCLRWSSWKEFLTERWDNFLSKGKKEKRERGGGTSLPRVSSRCLLVRAAHSKSRAVTSRRVIRVNYTQLPVFSTRQRCSLC